MPSKKIQSKKKGKGLINDIYRTGVKLLTGTDVRKNEYHIPTLNEKFGTNIT